MKAPKAVKLTAKIDADVLRGVRTQADREGIPFDQAVEAMLTIGLLELSLQKPRK